MTKRATPGFLQNLLLLLVLTTSLIPIRDATPEGDTLFTMMTKWNVSFTGWVQGGDPCADRWEHVECRDGQVVELNVTNSGIEGPLPSEIGDLRFLEHLDISNLYNAPNLTMNSPSGAFPETLAKCTVLKSFNASNTNWDIEFPSVLTKLMSLEELYMSATKIRGTIPDDLYNLSKLRYLFIGNNALQGSLLKLANLGNLVQLAVSQNNFKGTMPDELGNLTKLEYLNLHTCNLTGSLPDGMSKLKNLQRIDLHRNELTGPIPESWKNMTSMKQFRMEMNYLSGPLPGWMFSEWPNLNYVYLGRNSFSGPAPNITDLDAKYNVSYKYERLRWGCNYLNGTRPCSSPSCSNQTLSRTGGEDSPIDFDKNCYDNSGQSDLNDVSGDCDVYHPNDVSCGDFYQALNAGRCPKCPSGQVLFDPRPGRCVCELAGSVGGGGGGVPVGGVVGGVVGVSVVFLLIIAAILYKRRKHFSWLDIFTVKGPKEDGYWEAPPGVERFTLPELAKVTQNFDGINMIGQGGFGKVFVGTLDVGRMVAIKRATAGGLQGNSEFRNEVSLLSRLHHRHLVRLEGFCDEEGLQILVYEFMKKGNLHGHLLGKLTSTPLSSYQRLDIAYGVAQGLEYLHSFADPPVIHRDVKPSNILLDDNMVAKLSDFGISKVSPEYETHVSTRPAGTAGYLDPDYFLRRQLTTASDVYGYGVVLLELVTGQEAIDHNRLEEFNIIEWVKKRFKTRGVVSIVDPLIEDDYSPEAFAEMTKLGLQCCSFDRDERPSMKVVLATLEPLMMMLALMEPDGEQGKEWKKRKGMRVGFETKHPPEKTLIDNTQQSTSSDHTGRSNTSEVGTDPVLMSGPFESPR